MDVHKSSTYAGVERLCLRVGAPVFLSLSPGWMVTEKEQIPFPLNDNPYDYFTHLYKGMNYGLLGLLSPRVQGGESAVTCSDLNVHV